MSALMELQVYCMVATMRCHHLPEDGDMSSALDVTMK